MSKKWSNQQTHVCWPDMLPTCRPTCRRHDQKMVSAEVLTMPRRHVAYGYVGNMSAENLLTKILLSHVFNISTPLRQYASTPVCQYTSTPLRHYAITPLHQYTSTPVRQYAIMPLRHYASTSVRQYASTPVPQ